MSDLYLIAHKVRGEAAFDVATRMECPLCAGHGHDLDGVCHECDSTGYWWIIPTSGHRAYPFHAEPLNKDLIRYAEAMPPDLPDHYTHGASPSRLAQLQSLLPEAKPEPVYRRF